MNTAISAALSPKASSLGGAVERILSDAKEAARYAPNGEVTRLEQRAIGNIVVEYPNLNTESHVASLIWMVTFHGVAIGELKELLETYPPKRVYLVLEFLFEIGERTNKRSQYQIENADTIGLMEALLDFLQVVADAKPESMPQSIDAMDELVRSLGGVNIVTGIYTPEALLDALPAD